MSLELIYTSAPRGLGASSGGFCTVAATAGMSRQVSTKLEGLSGYQFHFGLSDARANQNPVNFAHTRVRIGAETLSVLSRIAFCGADYSGRTNKIAHHFLLERGEELPNGPAWMMMAMARGLFVAGWNSEPQNLAKRALGSIISGEVRPAEPATTWEAVTGDAGWAGMLVKAFRENPKVPAFVVFAPGAEVLPLFEESLALLLPEERWQVGFATYYTSLPAGCQYHWRGVLAGSPAAKEIARFPNATVIDLTAPLGEAEANEYTEAARTGRVLKPVQAAERPRIRIVESAGQAARVAASAAPAAAKEGEIEPWALERVAGPSADLPPVMVSPAELAALKARARRARWVPVLLAAMVLLAVSTAVLVALYVNEHPSWSLRRASEPASPQEAPSAEAVSTPPATAKDAKEQSAKPAASLPAKEATKGPASSKDLEQSIKDLQHILDEARGLMQVASSATGKAEKAQIGAAGSAANAKKDPAQALHHAANAKKLVQEASEAASAAEKAKTEAEEHRKKAELLWSKIKDLSPSDGAEMGLAKSCLDDIDEILKCTRTADDKCRKLLAQAQESLRDASVLASSSEKGAELLVERKLRDRQRPWDDAAMPTDGNGVMMPTAEPQGQDLCFSLGKGKTFRFLDLPDKVRGRVPVFKCEEQDRNTVLSVASRHLVNDTTLITCSIDDRCRLMCKFARIPDAPADVKAIQTWLVVEVASVERRRLYRCALTGKDERITRSVQCGYDDSSGHKLKCESSLQFQYPWQDSLSLRVGKSERVPFGKAEFSKSFHLAETDPATKTPTNKFKVDMDVRLKKSTDKKSTDGLGLSWDLAPFFQAVRTDLSTTDETKTQWKRANINYTEWSAKYKEGGSKEGEAKGQMEACLKGIKSIEEPLEKKVKPLLEAAREAFRKNGELMIYDAWEMPVVTVRLTFSGEANALVKAELGKE